MVKLHLMMKIIWYELLLLVYKMHAFMHILYSLAVVQEHNVIIRSMTPCRWMLVWLDSYHATIWQTSGRRLCFVSIIWLFPAINHAGRSVETTLSDLITLSVVYLSTISFGAPVLQVNVFMNWSFEWQQLCKSFVLRLHHRDYILMALRASGFAVFRICMLR